MFQTASCHTQKVENFVEYAQKSRTMPVFGVGLKLSSSKYKKKKKKVWDGKTKILKLKKKFRFKNPLNFTFKFI